MVTSEPGRRWGSGMVLMLALAAGCSGTQKSAPVTELPGVSPVQGLSAGELVRLCGDIATYVSQTLDSSYTCRAPAAYAALVSSMQLDAKDPDIQRACIQSYAVCLDAAAAALGDDGEPIDDCSIQGTGCAMTVDEVATCVRDLVAANVRVYGAYPLCHQITSDWLDWAKENAGVPEPIPPSCETLAKQCPEVYEGLVAAGLGEPVPFQP